MVEEHLLYLLEADPALVKVLV
jgi:hypothetical protein